MLCVQPLTSSQSQFLAPGRDSDWFSVSQLPTPALSEVVGVGRGEEWAPSQRWTVAAKSCPCGCKCQGKWASWANNPKSVFCDALRSFSNKSHGHNSNVNRRLEIDPIISSFLVLSGTQTGLRDKSQWLAPHEEFPHLWLLFLSG